MKDDVDLVERGSDCFAVTYVGLNEFSFWIDPRRFAASMSVRFKIIKNPNLPTLTHQQICDMRTDKTGTAGNESAVTHSAPKFCGPPLARTTSRRNFLVCGATAAGARSSSNSAHKRFNEWRSSTSYPFGRSITSIFNCFARS